MKNLALLTTSLILIIVSVAHSQTLHTLKFHNEKQTMSYFHYTGDGFFIICGHRGGATKGYPENSIPTLRHTLQATPAIFEVDPHLTKDKKIVMIHDATLNRVTTGHGRVDQYTLAQLKKLYLKDKEGNITPYHLNTLSQMIKWTNGKAIIKLDVKDVPLIMKAKLVKNLHAFNYVSFATHTVKQAKLLYNYDHHILIAPKILNKKTLKAYEKTNIPWSNYQFVYVGPVIDSTSKKLRDILHTKGVMVMISAATSYDRFQFKKERAKAYRKIIEHGFDIIESNRPLEVAEAVKSLYPKKSKKYSYWKFQKISK